MSSVLLTTGPDHEFPTPASTGTRPTDVPEPERRARTLGDLPTPRDILTVLPLGSHRSSLVANSRRAVRDVLRGDDDRLLVVVGPCSVHDPAAALEYARRLAAVSAELTDDLVVVMRVYFEKPRTTVGWKGLINDPHLDGSHDVHHGLPLARRVLLGVLDAGLPTACEFLEPAGPPYLADAVTWGAIGARNAESQVHRQFVSGLPMPVGFKNATDGNVQVAVDGCVTAASQHTFVSTDDTGRTVLMQTTGNPDCQVILRGGRSGPNYGPEDVAAALAVARAGDADRHTTYGVVVDASHGNSGKDHVRQAAVVREIAQRLADGERGITGLMMESFLVAGAQPPGTLEKLTYGQSVTDKCMDWDTTEVLLRTLATAIRARRTKPDEGAESAEVRDTRIGNTSLAVRSTRGE